MYFYFKIGLLTQSWNLLDEKKAVKNKKDICELILGYPCRANGNRGLLGKGVGCKWGKSGGVGPVGGGGEGRDS